MAGPSARMLQLLSLLQTHRFWPGAELAERLEVSERTLRRDVERLRDLGYPVAASRGVAGGYQLGTGAAMPPLLLDDEEAVAIAVGLRTAAAGPAADIAVRALTKVLQVMPPRLREQVNALQTYTASGPVSGPVVDAFSLTTLAQACRDSERVRFDYTSRSAVTAARSVEPHRLVSLGRRWYLVGWDIDRGDWRTFRLDRLASPRATGVRFRARELPGGDAAGFVQQSISSISRYRIMLVVHQKAALLEPLAAHWGSVQAIDDHTSRLELNVDTLEMAAFLLAVIDAPFDLIDPPEVRDYLRRLGQIFLK